MLRNRDFIIFSDDWGRHPFSCQHIMKHCLPHNRLLWVQTIGLRTPQPTLYDLKRSVEKIRSWLKPRIKDTHDPLPANLHILSPVMIPFNRIPAVRAFNRASVIRSVRRAMAELGMRSPLLLATVPNASDYAGAFGETLTVYYCVDDFTVWPKMNQPELVWEMEEALLAKSDMVIAVSQALRDTRSCPHGPVHLLPHGVDIEHFSVQESTLPPPEELKDMAKPIIGFYGLIDSHFDIDLMRKIVTARPGWQFVCIGTKRISLDPLESLPNFRWIPAVPYARLPAFAARFDVAIIPYVINRHTQTANPLKLPEYIATGKPVVTTPMPETFRFAGHIRIAGDSASFIKAIEESLADTTSAQSRRAALAGESWADKAERVSNWMEAALAGGPRRGREGEKS